MTMTCCMCYKPIDATANGTWLHGNNAEPLVVLDKSDPSIVDHERCCSKCNDLVLQVRIFMCMASGQHAASLCIQPFHSAKNQTDVIIAHARLTLSFPRGDDQ